MPLTGDFRGLGQLAANLRKLASVPSQAASEASETIQGLIEEEYDDGTDPYGRPWAPLRPSTLARGRRPPPLTDTGGMRQGTEVKPMQGAGIQITFDVPYAVFHMTGTKNMVARKVLPTNVLPATWNAAISDALASAAERKLGGK